MVKRSRRWDGLFRKFFPSTATLSRNPLFKIAGAVNDRVWRLFFSDFRQLPPNHLRVRVGVGNQLFNNQLLCLKSGTNYWFNAFAHGLCKFDSNIVEIGCGYGRKPMHLKNYEMQGEKYTGQYLGVDIDPELLNYARSIFPSPQFTFQLTPHQSKTYMPNGKSTESTPCRIERDDNSQDFVFSTSLFTHLLEQELVNYVEESYRVLRSGGVMQMNFFWYDYLQNAGVLGSRWTFAHAMGLARVESPEYPEAAVAYLGSDMTDLCKRIGFQRVELLSDPSGKMAQSFVRAWK